jgi:hypothetical protein
MNAITRLLKKTFWYPLRDVIYPIDMRPPYHSEGRDSNDIHFRYPSPGSEPIDDSYSVKNVTDYRLGFHDSIHSVRYREHSLVKPHAIEHLIVVDPMQNPKFLVEGDLSRH